MNYKQTDAPKIKINYQVSDIGCWKIGRSGDRAASPDSFVWKVGDRKQKASIDIEEDFLTGDVLASYRNLY